MITLISTPEYEDLIDPAIIYRWLATESPNNFRLHRRDFDIVTVSSYGATLLRLTVAAGTYGGSVGSIISVYNKTLNTMFLGEVLAGSGTTTIDTNIKFITGFAPGDPALDPDRLITYINDNTLYAGYYFEGRLTINGVEETLTVIASPDTFGYADLDVSGILRIHTSLGKTGDYTDLIMKEPTKSGNFSFEYRGCWYGSNEAWIPEGGCLSPPSDTILWYYGEAVRSEEQGSNLHEYVPSTEQDASFLNLFTQPVYFLGLPFDLSFILPQFADVSPASELIVTLKIYNSANAEPPLRTLVTSVPADELEGFINSLNIDETTIPALAHHMTAEIEIPE